MNSTVGMNELLPFNCHYQNDKVVILLVGSRNSTSKVVAQLKLAADSDADTLFNIHVAECLPLDPGSVLWKTRIDSIVFLVDMSEHLSLKLLESGLTQIAVEYFAGRHVTILSLMMEAYKQQVEVCSVGRLARSYQCGFYVGNLLQGEGMENVGRQLWGSAKAQAGINTKHNAFSLHALGHKY